MKKFVLLCAVALLVSSVNIGCTTGGSGGGLAGFCRTGSIFPTQTARQPQTVWMTQQRSAWNQCDPCMPVMCNPCEPAMCMPCEPVCHPCVPNFRMHMPGPM